MFVCSLLIRWVSRLHMARRVKREHLFQVKLARFTQNNLNYKFRLGHPLARSQTRSAPGWGHLPQRQTFHAAYPITFPRHGTSCLLSNCTSHWPLPPCPIISLPCGALLNLFQITGYNQTTTWLYFLCDLQSVCVWQGNENRVCVAFGVTEF